MRKESILKAPWLIAAVLLFGIASSAQKPAAKPTAKSKVEPRPVVFAVLDGGTRIEPIAEIESGKLVELAVEGDSGPKAWADAHYRAKMSYPLIFGGASDGTISVVKSNVGTECGGASAQTVVRSRNAKLSNLVMALGTNIKLKVGETGYRRRPTVAERNEIETLVRAEFAKNAVTAASMKNLRFHNLTALNIDGDDAPEFVGSYWIAPTAKDRRLLFFVAEPNANGKLEFVVSDYSAVKPDDVMSGDLKDLDTGVGHELLLDVLDIDGDGVKEIFTIGKAFEGNNYHVYKLGDGKWTKVHEAYAYRCAY